MEIDTAHALSASLAEVQRQGHISIIHPALAQISEQFSSDVASTAATNQVFERGTSHDFPTLNGDSNGRGSSTNHPGGGVQLHDTLARKVAYNTNHSVGGELSAFDFPTLPGGESLSSSSVGKSKSGKRPVKTVWKIDSQPMVPRTVGTNAPFQPIVIINSRAARISEDFPTLVSRDTTTLRPSTANTGRPAHSSTANPPPNPVKPPVLHDAFTVTKSVDQSSRSSSAVLSSRNFPTLGDSNVQPTAVSWGPGTNVKPALDVETKGARRKENLYKLDSNGFDSFMADEEARRCEKTARPKAKTLSDLASRFAGTSDYLVRSAENLSKVSSEDSSRSVPAGAGGKKGVEIGKRKKNQFSDNLERASTADNLDRPSSAKKLTEENHEVKAKHEQVSSRKESGKTNEKDQSAPKVSSTSGKESSAGPNYKTSAASSNESSKLSAMAASFQSSKESYKSNAATQKVSDKLVAAAQKDAQKEKLAAAAQKDTQKESNKLAAATQKEAEKELNKLAAAAQKDAQKESSKLAAAAQKDAQKESSKLAAAAQKDIDKSTALAQKVSDKLFANTPKEYEKSSFTTKNESFKLTGDVQVACKNATAKSDNDAKNNPKCKAVVENKGQPGNVANGNKDVKADNKAKTNGAGRDELVTTSSDNIKRAAKSSTLNKDVADKDDVKELHRVNECVAAKFVTKEVSGYSLDTTDSLDAKLKLMSTSDETTSVVPRVLESKDIVSLDSVLQIMSSDVDAAGASFTVDDFPSLLSKAPKKLVAPPPGFSVPSSNVTKPPPGFSAAPSASVTKPPPGFSGAFIGDVNSRPVPSVVIPSTANIYSPPQDLSDRNQRLIDRIKSRLNENGEEFKSFKTLSAEFRQGEISAKVYYEHCRTLMGSDGLLEILPELIVLLPDIDKQHELLSVYQTTSSEAKSSYKSATPWGQSGNETECDRLVSCPRCTQVLVAQDFIDHRAVHGFDSDYPVLGNVTDAQLSNSEQIGVR